MFKMWSAEAALRLRGRPLQGKWPQVVVQPCDNEKSKRYYRVNSKAIIARVSNRAAGRKVNG